MPHYSFRNVNDAFRRLVSDIHENQLPTVRTSSRVGDVIQVTMPVIATYGKPLERVLFNQARDANPFFHLMEALWMLAGRNDVAPMRYYASKIGDVASDDGRIFNGAYGYRWRNANPELRHGMLGERYEVVGTDQLKIIIDHLRRKPDSRRVVLSMWNVEDDLLKIDKAKDCCCNSHAYFLVNRGRLDLTVCNRSNDLEWGMLGANIVHFAFLLEYVAAHLKLPVGVYNQFTNNLHAYVDRWRPGEWLADTTPDYYAAHAPNQVKPFPLIEIPERFDEELPMFVGRVVGQDAPVPRSEFSEPFLRNVAWPAAAAFVAYKRKEYQRALEWCGAIEASDWRVAMTNWINKRYENRKNKDANSYLESELRRQRTPTAGQDKG